MGSRSFVLASVFVLLAPAIVVAHDESAGLSDPAERCESSQDPATTRPAERHAAATRPTSDERLDAAAVTPTPEPPAKSLVARQGLLVPAAFLAAASALSGLLVYAIKPRGATAPADHAKQ